MKHQHVLNLFLWWQDGTCTLCQLLCFAHDCFQDRNILLGTFTCPPTLLVGNGQSVYFLCPLLIALGFPLATRVYLRTNSWFFFFLVLSNGVRESHHVENYFICLCVHSALRGRTEHMGTNVVSFLLQDFLPTSREPIIFCMQNPQGIPDFSIWQSREEKRQKGKIISASWERHTETLSPLFLLYTRMMASCHLLYRKLSEWNSEALHQSHDSSSSDLCL